jgi:hypothetical protein
MHVSIHLVAYYIVDAHVGIACRHAGEASVKHVWMQAATGYDANLLRNPYLPGTRPPHAGNARPYSP